MHASPTLFWKSVVTVAAMMAGMAMFQYVPLPARGTTMKVVKLARRTVGTRGLSAEAREEQTAGYYQELLNGAANVVAKNPTAITKMVDAEEEPVAPELEELTANVADINEYSKGFLVYRPKGNLDIRDPRFNNVRHVTNSLGFNDREYPFEREPHTRRVLILGDSMARALGVESGQGFEPQLEASLNERARTPAIQKFELVNMGVSGYRLTQIVDLALLDGPKYRPDAYVLVVSWLTVGRKWGLHLAQMADEGIDPKYDFLRKVTTEANLRKGDSVRQTEARLARFMLPAFRWALDELANRAKADGAEFAVVLIPHLKGIGSYDGDFNPIRKVLKERGIPYADLLDTFDDVDIAALDVGDGLHPNAEGHRMLFEQLEKRIAADPQMAHVFTGAPAKP